MTLEVAVRHLVGAFALDVAFASEGPVTALFGPSGSGKSTIIGCINGLVRPHEARIGVGGRVLVDTAAGIHVPRHRRRVATVFQDARLFPHMTVAGNLAYGRRFRREAAPDALDFDAVVRLLGIGHLLDRRPRGLSGGEAQRVAIGRALLAAPRLLLLDEPLASLDAERRSELIPYFDRLHEIGLPIVYVSHHLGEVLHLADTVAILRHGRLAAFGPVGETLGALTAGAASGADIMTWTEGTATADETGGGRPATAEETDGLVRLATPLGALWVTAAAARPGVRQPVVIHGRDVMIAAEPPRAISALNVWPGRVTAVTPLDRAEALVTLRCGAAELSAVITRRSAAALALAPGREVYAVVKSVKIERPAVE